MVATFHDLARTAARAFFPPECCVVMDTLLRVSRISDDDLTMLLNINRKQLRRALGRLKDDGIIDRYVILLSIAHEISEIERGKKFFEPRPGEEDQPGYKQKFKYIEITYWHVDFKKLVDVVKYKLHKMKERVETELSIAMGPSTFRCEQCRSTYSEVEVPFLPIPFTCEHCNYTLREEDKGAHLAETTTLKDSFVLQMRPLLSLLQQVDKFIIPKYKNVQNVGGIEVLEAAMTRDEANGLSRDELLHRVEERAAAAEHRRKEKKPVEEISAKTISDRKKTSGVPSDFEHFGPSSAAVTVSLTDHGDEHVPEEAEAIKEAPKWFGDAAGTSTTTNTATGVDMDAWRTAYYEAVKKQQEAALNQGQSVWQVDEEEEEEYEEDTTMVQVGSESVPLSMVTEEHVAKMTPDEHRVYYELYEERLREYVSE